ncbi:MAG: ARMT1-like domain-containing protein [Candidatus Electrothrix aestuarii]|uniref:ARMT1-like domain-containing protein n=1 Tax=Candidatus Electrothrix aestuarii TaxID=3062594 RepID=A0AAU8LYE6_9BACT|nr:ARMT1-like domain-containing protein [Candidatus Electrothrix aestuarii]
MRTTLDCIVCFMRQARSTGLLATEDLVLQRQLLDGAGRYMEQVDTELSPPENAVGLYALFGEILGEDDPFARVKEEGNSFALSILDKVEQRVLATEDPLRAAVRVAIGGNIIDYGALHSFDVAKTIQECFDREFVWDDYPTLLEALQGKPKVLYLCDNCGEIVFDSLLIKQLKSLGCQVTAVVRDQPIINDATLADARACGLDEICTVISNGTRCPGTPLESCSAEFQEQFKEADLIISKGMGNFETLSEVSAPIFFLFTVKCSQVALHLSERQGFAPGFLKGDGEMVLLRQKEDIFDNTIL